MRFNPVDKWVRAGMSSGAHVEMRVRATCPDRIALLDTQRWHDRQVLRNWCKPNRGE